MVVGLRCLTDNGISQCTNYYWRVHDVWCTLLSQSWRCGWVRHHQQRPRQDKLSKSTASYRRRSLSLFVLSHRGRRKCDKIPVKMRLHFRGRKKSGAMEMPLPPPPTIRLTLIRQLFIRSFSYLTQTQYGITLSILLNWLSINTITGTLLDGQ